MRGPRTDEVIERAPMSVGRPFLFAGMLVLALAGCSAADQADLVTAAWDGGLCVDLERWSGSGWEWIGSASYEQAHRGRWGPPDHPPSCNAAAVLDGSVALPADAGPGTYRVCSILDRDDDNCVVLTRPD